MPLSHTWIELESDLLQVGEGRKYGNQLFEKINIIYRPNCCRLACPFARSLGTNALSIARIITSIVREFANDAWRL
jgi:hypothetical protein